MGVARSHAKRDALFYKLVAALDLLTLLLRWLIGGLVGSSGATARPKLPAACLAPRALPRRSITNWRVRLPVMAAEEPECLRDKTAPLSIADMKARQATKIREIGEALMSVGLVTLDAQANALRLPRSTTWTILTAEHKGYGISAKIISRMLNSEQLPRLVRAKIMEYAQEKAAGLYGGTQTHRLRLDRR